MALEAGDKEVMDEIAEAAAYLFTALMKQNHTDRGPGHQPVFTGDQAIQIVAAATPVIANAAARTIRRSAGNVGRGDIGPRD